jgi:hypothetical protein
MKILLDIFSDYGTIISSSSEAASGNMKAKNVINQVPLLTLSIAL